MKGPASSIAIGPLVPGDLVAAVAIDVEAFVSGELGSGADDGALARERSLREELARPWARIRAARDAEGTLFGYALFWHVVDEIHLLNVAVAAPARRLGIGRALMDDLLVYGRDRGIVRVLLEVRRSNAPALALYASLGFEVFHERAGYYADGEDALEMSLSLPAAPPSP